MKGKNTFVVIPDWTLPLDLDLTETVILSIIYGFSQDGETTFRGSWKYLERHAKCSRAKVGKSLKRLVDLGYIRKKDVFVQGVKFCEYFVQTGGLQDRRVVSIGDGGSTVETGIVSHVDGGGLPERHNNIEDNAFSNEKANSDSSARAHTRKDFDFKSALLDIGVSEEAASDWMLVRKNAKATNTRTAFDQLRAQIDKICRIHGVTPDDVVRFAVGHDWRGIDASWEAVKNIKTYADNLRNTEEDDNLPF